MTVASFGVVMTDVASRSWRLGAIVALAFIQLLAQRKYFRYLGMRRDQREEGVIFLCTAAITAIVAAGSLWVMHNADTNTNTNMMPTHTTPEVAHLRE